MQTSSTNLRTIPFMTDTGDLSTVFHHGYYRFVVYSWEFDSIQDGDSNHDYFLVFISATSRALPNIHGWCPGDGTGGPETSTQSVDVSISTPSASIMPDKIRPLTGEHGDEFGALEVNLGFEFSGISAGISWSQITYQWEVKLKSASTSGVSWRATEHSGCTDAAFIWGYAFGISAPEGVSPTISVEVNPFFYTCEGSTPFTCDNFQIDEGNQQQGRKTLTLGSPFPPVVLIQTNPLVGSIILNGTEFLPGQQAASVPGNYSATAIPPEEYTFDHWEAKDGVSFRKLPADPQQFGNPTVVNVTGNGLLRAIFAAKLTFLTDPPNVGSVSFTASVGPGGVPCGPGHPNEDWVYVQRLPPEFAGVAGYVGACANTPHGYEFDHWSTTAQLIGPSDSTNTLIALTGPSTMKAWFTKILSPVGNPSAPSSLVATGQYGHTDLTWNPPVADGGSQITGYQIYRGPSFGTLTVLTSVGNQNWYQDSSVTNGQLYYYRVTAVNSAGESSPSNVDSAKPGIDQIIISPDTKSVLTGGQVQFSATAKAESGEIIQGVSFAWTTSVPGSTITDTGLFKAGTVVGTFTEEVSASSAGVNKYATVIVQAPPTTRSGTSNLSFLPDFGNLWALIPGAIVMVASAMGVVVYRNKKNGTLPKR